MDAVFPKEELISRSAIRGYGGESEKVIDDFEEINTEQLENHMNIVQNNLLSLEKCIEKKLEKINELTQIAIKSVELSEKLKAKHCKEDEPGGVEESKVVDVKDVDVNVRVEEEGEGKVEEDGRKKKKSGKKKSGKKKSIKKKSGKKKSIKKKK